MKGRTFKFATGKPVKPNNYIVFLPTVEAQEQHAEFFAAQARIAQQQEDGRIGILEALIGLAKQGGR